MMRIGVLLLALLLAGCAGRSPEAPLNSSLLAGKSLWISPVRNSTNTDLRLPGTNPLRSLGELAGKVSPDDRPTVSDLLRDALRREAEQRKVPARYPEEYDARLKTLPSSAEAAARTARDAKLEGALLLIEVRRWESEAAGLLRVWVDFKLVRIADGALAWERRVQKVRAVGRSGNPAETHQDAVREIAQELF